MMASAPPTRSFTSNPHPKITPLAAERKADEEAKFEAWLQTPEGQAAAANKAKADYEANERLKDVFNDLSLGQSDEDGQSSSGHGKPRKNKAKHEAKKGTGFLSALALKLKPKDK